MKYNRMEIKIRFYGFLRERFAGIRYIMLDFCPQLIRFCSHIMTVNLWGGGGGVSGSRTGS